MRFIRVHGRVVPIRDEKDKASSSAKKAGVSGAALGASYHALHEYKAAAKENAVRNARNLRTFKARLLPGDIITLGSSAKHPSGTTLEDAVSNLPKSFHKPVNKIARKFGLSKNSLLLSNATVLPIAGAGSKYHAGIYLGKGRVAHLTTDAGVQNESLASVVAKQNVTAHRFKNQSPQETEAALKFAREAVKRHVPYQSFGEYVKNPISNIGLPIGKQPSRSFKPMVCHTLPIRAYANRMWGLHGERTMAGDFKKVPGLEMIARRHTINTPFTTIKGYAGVGLRGLKWGVLAAGATAAVAYLRNRKKGVSNGRTS